MIEVSHLTKQYGDHRAVSDLSFTIEDNRIYGLLGPNGAGKSTTMNIMTGCLAASSGSVTVNGFDIFEEPVKAKKCIGYLPELPPVYPMLTPQEYLGFVAKAKGVSKKQVEEQVGAAIKATGLENYAGRLIKNLSKGYRQRVGIAQALIGDPQVIILDEPMVGLDPKQIIEIRDLIKNLKEKHTVILSSHILPEIRSICDHLIIINKGTLVANDTPEKLEQMYMAKSNITLSAEASAEDVSAILSGVEGLRGFSCEEKDDGTCTAVIQQVPDRDLSRAVFFAFSRAGKPILSMSNAHVTLEDVFLELTGGMDEEKEEGKEAEA